MTELLSSLSDRELHEETLRASVREKDACLVLLRHLAEVDRRGLYADRGFSSLWEYTHRYLGYSESQASERVSAMRLMVKIPEVEKKLETRELTLTSVAKLAVHVKREHSTLEETAVLLEKIENQPTREVERILASEVVGLVPEPDRVKPISRHLTRITLEVDSDFMALLERAQELGAHAGAMPQEIIKRTLREFVRRREIKEEKREPSPVLRAPEVQRPSRYIPASDRQEIRKRSRDRCEFIDPVTKRRCEARHRLEFDHIRPFSLGGESRASNLRRLCRAHNLLKGVHHFGRQKMRVESAQQNRLKPERPGPEFRLASVRPRR